MTDLSREQALDAGMVIDYSDVAAPLGYVWPVAISEQMEAQMFTTIPQGLSLGGMESALVAAVTDTLKFTLDRMEAAGRDPELVSRNQLSLVMPTSWNEGGMLAFTLTIEPDGDDQPAFTLSLSEEQK